MNQIETIQNTILQNNAARPFRLEKLLKKRPPEETLETFLVNFFTKWNENRNTIYVDNKQVQTPIKKRRSLSDIFMICRYYYPTCTLEEVLRLLYSRLSNLIDPGFRTSYCNTILKRVWYYKPDEKNAILNKEYVDEFGFTAHHYIQWLAGNFNYNQQPDDDDDFSYEEEDDD